MLLPRVHARGHAPRSTVGGSTVSGPRRAAAARMIGLTRETTDGRYQPVCARCTALLEPYGRRSLALVDLERHTVAAHGEVGT
jgi:hypothetical protein